MLSGWARREPPQGSLAACVVPVARVAPVSSESPAAVLAGQPVLHVPDIRRDIGYGWLGVITFHERRHGRVTKGNPFTPPSVGLLRAVASAAGALLFEPGIVEGDNYICLSIHLIDTL